MKEMIKRSLTISGEIIRALFELLVLSFEPLVMLAILIFVASNAISTINKLKLMENGIINIQETQQTTEGEKNVRQE